MIDEKLANVLCDVLDLEYKELSENLSREEIEKWDSLNHLRLVTALEAEYEIVLTMDQIITITTVADIQRLINHPAN